MSTQPITNQTTPQGAQTATPANPASTLNDNQFLQLMVAQLQQQDPLNPTDSTSYLSELAQFTTLEQETNTANNTLKLENSNQTDEALRLLGQNVTYTDATGNAASGLVSSVDLTGSAPTLTIGATSGITTGQVQTVS